jgi:hypothetical protein
MPNSNRDVAVRIALLLAVASLVFSRGVLADVRPPGASGSAPAPSGLVVVIESNPNWPLDLRALDNPNISGVAIQIHWADLEPAEGKPDWARLDKLFAAAESSKKWVQLLIFPGFFSPTWALDGVHTESFPLQYGPGSGEDKLLPIPWDRTYLHRWLDFVKQLSERYGNSPAFRLVAAAGPTSVSAEFTLPGSPADLKKWQRIGYKPSKYIGAWKEVFQAYADEFPNQYISLSEGGGLNINEQGKLHPQERLQTRRAVVDLAREILGRRFALQMSDVHAGPGPRVANSEGEDQFVIGYIGKVTTGFQLRTSALHSSRVMGAEGDPPLALKKSIDLALKTNQAGQHVNYVEIYQPDVLAPQMQEVLRYGASLFMR